MKILFKPTGVRKIMGCIALGLIANATALKAQEASTISTNRLYSLQEIKEKWGIVPLPQIKEAAEKGEPTALHYVGYYYFTGLDGTTNYPEAFKWFQKAAEKNFPNAQNNLGLAYLNGWGVSTNLTEAKRFFRLAAEQGFPTAQVNLAKVLTAGRSREDRQEARKWLEQGARGGDPEAQVQLGKYLTKTPGMPLEFDNALYWFKKAYAQGRTDICSNIGWIYAEGHTKTGQDYPTALEWFHKGAEKGDAYCEVSLGWMYVHGWGVEKNYQEALKWAQKSADQGNAGGQLNLGKMYEVRDIPFEGSIQPDYEKAAFWYRKAAVQGNRDAAQLLAELYQSNRVKTTPEGTLDGLRKAADAGSQKAIFDLAVFYEKGGATPRNPEEVPQAAYQKLAVVRFGPALHLLSERYRTGDRLPKDEVKAFQYDLIAENLMDYTREAFQRLKVEATKSAPNGAGGSAHEYVQLLYQTMRGPDKEAPVKLARQYLKGDVLPKDLMAAYVWFLVAASRGEASVKTEGDELRAKLNQAQITDAEKWARHFQFISEVIRQQFPNE